MARPSARNSPTTSTVTPSCWTRQRKPRRERHHGSTANDGSDDASSHCGRSPRRRPIDSPSRTRRTLLIASGCACWRSTSRRTARDVRPRRRAQSHRRRSQASAAELGVPVHELRLVPDDDAPDVSYTPSRLWASVEGATRKGTAMTVTDLLAQMKAHLTSLGTGRDLTTDDARALFWADYNTKQGVITTSMDPPAQSASMRWPVASAPRRVAREEEALTTESRRSRTGALAGNLRERDADTSGRTSPVRAAAPARGHVVCVPARRSARSPSWRSASPDSKCA